MWLIHHVFENLKYNYNDNIHVDNNKIRTLEIMREKIGITVNNEDGKDEFPVSSQTHLHWYILSVRWSTVRSTLLAQQLKRLSYCDVLYHEQVYSKCLLCVMFVLPCKRTFL